MKDKYFFLSNFYPCTVIIDIDNKIYTFKNVESAFQAQKNNELASKFCLLQALEAKKYGEVIPITTPDWNLYQLIAMAKCLHSKFKLNSNLLQDLKQINEPIINENYWKDDFWGVYKGRGKNILGKMLINIKDNDNNYEQLIEYINNDLIKDCK